MNNYGQPGRRLKRIPGWDEWYGLQGNSKYWLRSLQPGVAEHHGNDYYADYFTNRVANRSLEFMHNAISQEKPFFALVALASHAPNTPAPQYEEAYAGRKAPRLTSFNVSGQTSTILCVKSSPSTKLMPM